MDRQSLELALVELDDLLAGDDTPESDLQAWFERHPAVFDAYGFQRAVPHARLEAPAGLLIPDFLVQRVDNLWEVVELKRKEVPLVREAPRQTFYAQFEQYYAQCRSYSEFFKQDHLRERFNAESGLGVQADVKAIVVAGRSRAEDFAAVHKLLSDRGGRVALQTYDHVRAQLEFYRKKLYGADEQLAGLFVFMFLVPEKIPAGENHVLDLGTDLERNRVSVTITARDELALRVFSDDKRLHSATIPLEKAGILYGLPTYLLLQVGFAQSHTVIRVEINGEHFFDRRLDAFALNPETTEHLVVGSNIDGTGHSAMSLIEWGLGSTPMSFDQRWGLAAYFGTKYARCFDEPGWFPSRVTFSGNQFLYSKNHPNFPPQAG